MKVACIGGGPGGLYSSILLKAASPETDVVVYERNAPTDTFGFGVVFSAATLARLEAADAVSHAQLTAASARWDPVEVRYGGRRIRAHGNRFAAISRHRLLEILQGRAMELGVDVRFQTEVAQIDAVLEADLVIGADGLRSAVRERFAQHFRPRLVQEGCKYIWLGTTQRFDAFTFIFESTPAGLFQAHIYPFSERQSTFIVECSPATWRAAGFDAVDASALAPGESDHASIAELEKLFGDHLDGHGLTPNNSKWLDWTTVRNGSWRHENVVLIGDAAHTAHFSIGSGTKLALEDAIALSDAVVGAPDIATALADYESARKPGVDGIQQAAEESLAWFGRYDRYWGFDAPQFAYSLLTRSKRVDYRNLRTRDPEFVAAFDQWYAARPGTSPAADLLAAPPPALTAVDIGRTRLRNRIALLSPTAAGADDGHVSQPHLDQLHRSLRSGAGLVVVDGVAVSREGRATPEDAGLYADTHADQWAAVLDDLDGQAPVVGVRLVHAGPRAACRARVAGADLPLPSSQRWPLLAASATPYTVVSAMPREASRDDLEQVREDYRVATIRARDAGFGALELQFGQGQLPATFLSPLTNHRTDEYGGDLDGRSRFPLELLAAVREVWPDDRLLTVCFSASDLQPGGLSTDDAVELARRFAGHGADLLHVVAGQTTPRSRAEFGPGFNAPWSDLVRNRAGVSTMTSGNLPDLAQVHHVLAGGQADLCVLGRPLQQAPAWLI